MLEALACGTPVAAFPVQGPIDVVGGSGVAVLDEDLREAALHALRIDRTRGRAHAEQYSWRAATVQFLTLQQALPSSAPLARTAPGDAR
jgi:glycosyltransferase involved in cell wall biosynthesis